MSVFLLKLKLLDEISAGSGPLVPCIPHLKVRLVLTVESVFRKVEF